MTQARNNNRKEAKNTSSVYKVGKIPPQALDVETGVLGALLLEKEAYIICSEILCKDAFYKEANQIIYEAIEILNSKNEPVDMITATQQLREMGKLEAVGGAFYITQLTAHVASAANVEFHARVIQQKYIARAAIRFSSELQELSYDDSIDIDDIITKFLTNADQLAKLANSGNQIIPYSKLLEDAIERAKVRATKADNNELIGIPSSLNCIRKFKQSYLPGDLIIIAGRPGMGKTAFALAEARFIASLGLSVLFFSIEMTKEELADRNIIAESNINSDEYKSGKINSWQWEKIDFAISNSIDYNLFIDDTSRIKVSHIIKTAKIFKNKGQLDAIFIDYLQMMNTSSGNRNSNTAEEISLVTKTLKGLAKELGVPIILLSQLNREVENRPSRQPQLSDLKQSGAIEEDADCVMFPFRGEYYWKDLPELKGVIEIIIAKNRGGATGSAFANVSYNVANFIDREVEAPEYTPNDNTEAF